MFVSPFFFIHLRLVAAGSSRSVVAATIMECNKQHPPKSVPRNNTHRTRRKSFGIRIFSYIGYHYPCNSVTFLLRPCSEKKYNTINSI